MSSGSAVSAPSGARSPAPAKGAPARKKARARPASETLLVTLVINEQAVPGIVQVERLADSRLAMPLEIWTAAHMRTAGEAVALPDGQAGYCLESVPGLTYRVDRERLTLDLTVPAAAFDSSTYSLGEARAMPSDTASAGLYANYSLAATRDPAAGSSYGGLVEAVFFNGGGALRGSLVSGLAVSAGGQGASAIRTDTYWRRDDPKNMRTLVLGDTVGGDGGWSQPVRYAGIRYGRDFSLAPGYISYPLPALSGSAALPSTVEVLINSQRQSTASVQPGPFSLTNVPVVSGAGEINLVVRDLRGVETVITQGYYSSTRLLAPGLSDFSFEAGALRREYGSASNVYGPGFAAASYRYGVSPGLTAGARLELQRTRQAGGVDGMALLGTFAVARAAAAYSRSSGGDGMGGSGGARWLAAVERSTRQGGGALQWEHFGEGYAPFGAGDSESGRASWPRGRLQANAGVTPWSGTSMGLTYIRQSSRSGATFALAGVNAGASLAREVSVSVFARKQLATHEGWSVGLNLLVSLAKQRSFTAASSKDPGGGWSTYAQAGSPAQFGQGWAWSARASDQPSQVLRAAATLYSNVGQFTAELNAGRDANALRAGADGSVGWLEGLPFATRRIGDGAFAVVRVGDIEGVAVSRSSQVMATTNRRGLAVVSGLLPYQQNVLSMDPDRLPFDADIGGVRQSVVPYARSGVLVEFPVRRSRNVLVVLRQAGGEPVPPGARVVLSPGNRQFIVARRGEVYLMDIQDGSKDDSRIEVKWKDGGCALSLPLAGGPAAEPETRLGPLTCGGQP
jgi:outer membrane usher protein